MTETAIVFRSESALGHITLNRPNALNALTHGMCTSMLQQLQVWARNPDIRAVLIDAVPGRAFCAGGDLRAIYELGRSADAAAERFFATEYRLNAAIKHFPKPYLAVIDGIVMGGGVGVSVHGTHRVVSENAVFAMPETGIGLYPDVGGSYFLPRLPGQTGTYLALTGARLRAVDMLYAGIATHFVPAKDLSTIAPRLAQGESPEAVLRSLCRDPDPPALAVQRPAIDAAFAEGSVEAIAEALEAGGPWEKDAASVLAGCSPTSLKLTLREMREGMALDFDSCMRMEYRLTLRVLRGHDLYEGIRAVLIDRDRRPRWQPATLHEVTDSDIGRYFAPLAQGDLIL